MASGVKRWVIGGRMRRGGQRGGERDCFGKMSELNRSEKVEKAARRKG